MENSKRVLAIGCVHVAASIVVGGLNGLLFVYTYDLRAYSGLSEFLVFGAVVAIYNIPGLIVTVVGLKKSGEFDGRLVVLTSLTAMAAAIGVSIIWFFISFGLIFFGPLTSLAVSLMLLPLLKWARRVHGKPKSRVGPIGEGNLEQDKVWASRLRRARELHAGGIQDADTSAMDDVRGDRL